MKKGTSVSWKLKNGTEGFGHTITDQDDNGKIQVAVDRQNNQDVELHYIIECNVTWLTPVAPKAASAPETAAKAE